MDNYPIGRVLSEVFDAIFITEKRELSPGSASSACTAAIIRRFDPSLRKSSLIYYPTPHTARVKISKSPMDLLHKSLLSVISALRSPVLSKLRKEQVVCYQAEHAWQVGFSKSRYHDRHLHQCNGYCGLPYSTFSSLRNCFTVSIYWVEASSLANFGHTFSIAICRS